MCTHSDMESEMSRTDAHFAATGSKNVGLSGSFVDDDGLARSHRSAIASTVLPTQVLSASVAVASSVPSGPCDSTILMSSDMCCVCYVEDLYLFCKFIRHAFVWMLLGRGRSDVPDAGGLVRRIVTGHGLVSVLRVCVDPGVEVWVRSDPQLAHS